MGPVAKADTDVGIEDDELVEIGFGGDRTPGRWSLG